MNQRYLLALVLTAFVLVVTPLMFSRPKPATISPSDSSSTKTAPESTAPQPIQPVSARAIGPTKTEFAGVGVGETTSVRTARARYVFTNTGATPVAVTLDSYPSRRAGQKNVGSSLVESGDRMLRLSFTLGRDTVYLDTLQLTRVSSTATTIDYAGTTVGLPIRVSYKLPSVATDEYLLRASVVISGAPAAQPGKKRRAGLHNEA